MTVAVSEMEKELAPNTPESEIRQGSEDKKKGKKDTEIAKGQEGVTKANKAKGKSLDKEEEVEDGCGCDGKKKRSKKDMAFTASAIKKDACWKGYVQQGMKMKGGKRDSQAWADSIGALTADHFRDDVFVGNKKSLKCGPTSKKCGNACIPKSHKCRASWNKPVKVAATVAGVGAVAVGATALLHSRPAARAAARALIEPVTQAGFGAGNIARGNLVGASKNILNVVNTSKGVGRASRSLAREYGTDLKSLQNRFKRSSFKAKYHKRAKGGRVPGLKYDSLLAEAVRDDACWKGYVQQGMKMKGGKRVPNCVPAGAKKKKDGAYGKKADGGSCGKKGKSVWADGYEFDAATLAMGSSNLATDTNKNATRKPNAFSSTRNKIIAGTLNT